MEEANRLLFLAKISQGCPEPAEQAKELCRTIVSRIGVSSLTEPLIAFGHAVAKGQCIAKGIQLDKMNLPMESVLTPAESAGFLHSILLGASKSTLQQMSLEVTDVQQFIKELQTLPEMDGLTHLRQTLSNAYLVLTDIHLLLRPLVGLGTSPQFDPTTLSLLSLSLSWQFHTMMSRLRLACWLWQIRPRA